MKLKGIGILFVPLSILGYRKFDTVFDSWLFQQGVRRRTLEKYIQEHNILYDLQYWSTVEKKKLYINDRGIFLAILMCKQTFPWRLCNTFFIILILARLYSAEEDDEEEI